MLIILQAISGSLIYLGVMAHQSPLWAVVSDSIGFDLQTMIYMTGLFTGCTCFLLSFTAFISAFVRFKPCYMPVSLLHFHV